MKGVTGLYLVGALALAGAGVAAPAGSAQRKAAASSLYRLTAPPSAAFDWFPALPHIGEPVTLVSTSTDLASPIAAYGWDVADLGLFVPGGQVTSTTFWTPASHRVQLRVTSADGLSGVVSKAITMSPAAPDVMHPFPIVRIDAIDYRFGTKIKRLVVQAPPRSHITLACHGAGCPAPSGRRAAVPRSSRSLVALSFPRFERLLRAGTSLRVRVSRGREIGAYMRLTVRSRKLPVRIDSCLDPAGVKPILCPS